jgi:hypothetical protein
MVNNKENTINYSGTFLLIVLCLFFISAFADKSANQAFSSTQYGFISDLRTNPAKAVIVDAIHLPSLQKSCLSLLYNANFYLVKEGLKIVTDDRKIAQSIIALHKTRLKIKPLSVFKFYYHLLSADAEELPFLG